MIDKHPLDRRELKQVLHRDDLVEGLHLARDWAKAHLEAILIGTLVAAAVVFGAVFYVQGQRQKALEASKLLGEAQQLFRRAQAAEPAEQAEAFNQAYARYQALLSTYENSPQAPAARLGMANALLALGRFAEAEQEYAALDSGDPKDPIAVMAALGRARIREAQAGQAGAPGAALQQALERLKAPEKK